MKNVLVFGSILAATAAAFACGDSSGEGGGGGSTTQGSTSPATGSGSTSTKAASTSGNTTASSGANSVSSTSAASTSGTAASSGSGMACAPTGDVCQDCIFMTCCDEYTACAADVACQTCMDCLQTTGIACLTNGMCNLGDATQGAFIMCAQGCQTECT